jgi:hypothetical protein
LLGVSSLDLSLEGFSLGERRFFVGEVYLQRGIALSGHIELEIGLGWRFVFLRAWA